MIQSGENIAETKICQISGEKFFITDKDMEFYDKISPVFGGKKYSIPSPTLSPLERQRRRLSFRNEQSLYMRKCDLSGKQIISMYDAQSPYKVYDKDVWYSDEWDPYSYGRDFDFEKTFFDQFEKLFLDVPRMARVQQSGMENSEFCNCAARCKNCYLCFSTNETEDSMYGTFNNFAYRCLDCYNIVNCEYCYECMDCYRCKNCIYTQESTDCSDCFFCKSCVGCRDCIFSTNLRQKQYCIMNTQYTKQDYEDKKKELLCSTYDRFQKLAQTYYNIVSKAPTKYMTGIQNEHASGNILDHCKNAYECFECSDLENCKYLSNVSKVKDCMDYNYWGINCDHLYEVMAAGFNCSNLLFCDHVWENNSHIILSESCMHSSQLLGCDGIRNAKNCILNKPYSKQEYETLAGKILDHMISTNEWGEFFPAEMSDFGYNETVANDYFPLTKDEVIKRGWKWRDDDETQGYHGQYHSPLAIEQYDESAVGPENAKKNIDDCTSQIHLCKDTKKPFKIIPLELAFYIEHKLPIPTLSPSARHKKRIQHRNPRSTRADVCHKCSKQIQTSYTKETSGPILCETCYERILSESN